MSTHVVAPATAPAVQAPAAQAPEAHRQLLLWDDQPTDLFGQKAQPIPGPVDAMPVGRPPAAIAVATPVPASAPAVTPEAAAPPAPPAPMPSAVLPDASPPPAPLAEAIPAQPPALPVPSTTDPWSRDVYRQVAARAVAADLPAAAYLQVFDWLVASELQQRQELNGKTIKEISPKAVGRMSKPQLIDTIIDTRRRRLCLDGYVVDGMSMLRGGSAHDTAVRDAQREALLKLTDERLATLRREAAEQAASDARSVSDPRSLVEFRRFLVVTKGSLASWSDDQIRRWDQLETDQHLEERLRQRAQQAKIQAVDVGGATAAIIPTKHTQKGHALWVVQLSERVATDRFRTLDSAAKRLGGYYSSYRAGGAVPGFQFTSEQAAKDFVGLTRGDAVDLTQVDEDRRIERIANAAERMDQLAARAVAKAEAAIEHAESARQNTARRAQHAAQAIRNGGAQKQLAQTLGNIAQMIRDGSCEYLDGIRHLVDVQQIEGVLRRAHWDWAQREQDANRGRCDDIVRNQAPTEACVRYARPPILQVWPADLRAAASSLSTKPGCKQLANRLAKRVISEDERVELKMEDPLFEQLASTARDLGEGGGSAIRMIGDQISDLGRLQRMGATDVHSLRQMLREYLQVRAESQRPDPIREAERALIGSTIPGFFPTPRTLVRQLMARADIAKGMRVLEPSAGKGDLADAARDAGGEVDVVECAHSLREILTMKGHRLIGSDCLALTEGGYDRVVANPPFEQGQDAVHIRHAVGLLKPGGRLVSIMSVGPFQRQDSASEAFRAWFAEVGGTRVDNPDGSFASAEAFRSTGVSSVTVSITKL